MSKQVIHTEQAPAAIGNYSQAIQAGNTVYFSGQIPLDPKTGELVQGDFAANVHQIFKNLQAVAQASGGDFTKIVKLNIFVTDITTMPTVNAIMGEYFSQPFPARSSIAVSALPKGVPVEIEAIMVV
jgi:reactive intermediate/imine deaminase